MTYATDLPNPPPTPSSTSNVWSRRLFRTSLAIAAALVGWTPLNFGPMTPPSSEAIAAPIDAVEGPPRVAQWIDNEIYALRQSQRRWIEINLTDQRLIAWEGDHPVYAVFVSTGTYATPTPTGVYEIYVKYPEAPMSGPGYHIPDVPYVMYYDGNYGIHGAYWHNNFGTPMSRGCTNVALDHAAWLYSWASVGTPVVVRR
ncbi:L,D-transpeptidase [Sodalinema gerasimenkoae]|uniref:L,D-transpeptidase n=1 Tax=Sodalinema gerasimenkoae TaxID=2862348 RepID=UPI001FE56F57|nr:L,D-transpeptidase [Sodalinema gerasimenkoae]